MNLKIFIEKLQKIAMEHGDDMKVIMADNIPVISPVFCTKYPDGKNVAITDQR